MREREDKKVISQNKKVKENKRTLIIFGFLALLIVGSVFSVVTKDVSAAFEYEPMEKIPGFENETKGTDLIAWIESIYKFGIWTVGIAALFMITLGGFIYMTAAGNTSKAGTGKDYITDALIGLVLALVAYVLLYIINPNLTEVELNITPVNVEKAGATSSGEIPNHTPTTLNPEEEQEIRDRLSAAGISVNRACSSSAPTTCVAGLPESTIEKLIEMKKDTGCDMRITGGTEGSLGGHTGGCHKSGTACVDLSKNSCLGAVMASQSSRDKYGISQICTDNQDGQRSRYTYNCGNYVEANPHFHLKIS
jgi:hypothetical protein